MTVRHILLATASVAALLGASSARAQMAVIDSANLANTAKTVAQGEQQVQQLTAQLKNMEQQLATAEQTFASLSHAVSNPLQASASQFNVPALRNVLPTGSGALGSIVTGTGLGNTGYLGTQNLNANHIYTPAGTDFNATQMATNANSIAGVQAAAQQLYQSASSHMATMADLETQLNDSPDQKTTSDLQARIAQEQAYLQAQQVQASTLQTLQAAQVRNVEQQDEEMHRKNIDDVLAEDAAATPGS